MPARPLPDRRHEGIGGVAIRSRRGHKTIVTIGRRETRCRQCVPVDLPHQQQRAPGAVAALHPATLPVVAGAPQVAYLELARVVLDEDRPPLPLRLEHQLDAAVIEVVARHLLRCQLHPRRVISAVVISRAQVPSGIPAAALSGALLECCGDDGVLVDPVGVPRLRCPGPPGRRAPPSRRSILQKGHLREASDAAVVAVLIRAVGMALHPSSSPCWLQTPAGPPVDGRSRGGRPGRPGQDRNPLRARVVNGRQGEGGTGSRDGVSAERLARAEVLAEQVGAQLPALDGVEHP